jgi:hypothetical protein
MARNVKPTTERAKRDGPHLIMRPEPDEPRDRALARTLLGPSASNALTLYSVLDRSLGGKSELTLDGLMQELSAQSDEVAKGDLTRPEAMLTAHTHTLDALFNGLTRLAYTYTNIDGFERLLRLALKTQGQARATVETLAAIKNPPIVFAKQANMTSGPQQINNGLARGIPAAVPNKLLEQIDGERLDPITASGALNCNSEMATVGVVNGTSHG